MRIGLISGEFPPMPGGVGHFSRILAEQLQAQGRAVQVFSRAGSSSDQLEITTVSGWGLNTVSKIKTWANDNELDVINVQFQTAAYDMSPWIHFLPSMLDQPIVTTFHDLRHPYLFPKAGRLRDWTVMHLAQSADGVIATNPEDAQKLARVPMLSVIPIGSSIPCEVSNGSSTAHWREKLGAGDSTILVGHFGFIKEIKGIDYLIDALADLRKKGFDFRLLFIGGQSNTVDDGLGDNYHEQLETRIREHGLNDDVYWTGYLPEAEVAACFKAVDLVALPFLDGASYRRSSLMAAINCGCAIVTTQPTVEYETFIHSENMWLIDRQSASAISDALIHLLQNPQKLNDLSKGAQDLRVRFDWDVIARDTIAFFEDVLRATGQQQAREED